MEMKIGSIQLPIPFCQAGLAGYSDRAMRVVARRRGCPYAVTEALLDVIMLSGEMEIGLGNGSKHTVRPGDVLLAEDLTGQGHTRRITSSEPRISATVPLAD